MTDQEHDARVKERLGVSNLAYYVNAFNQAQKRTGYKGRFGERELGVRMSMSSPYGWSCELRLTESPNRSGRPDRSYVTHSIAQSLPDGALARCLADMCDWKRLPRLADLSDQLEACPEEEEWDSLFYVEALAAYWHIEATVEALGGPCTTWSAQLCVAVGEPPLAEERGLSGSWDATAAEGLGGGPDGAMIRALDAMLGVRPLPDADRVFAALDADEGDQLRAEYAYMPIDDAVLAGNVSSD